MDPTNKSILCNVHSRCLPSLFHKRLQTFQCCIYSFSGAYYDLHYLFVKSYTYAHNPYLGSSLALVLAFLLLMRIVLSDQCSQARHFFYGVKVRVEFNSLALAI